MVDETNWPYIQWIVEDICGDGIRRHNSAEECEDGNNVDGDGCSANC